MEYSYSTIEQYLSLEQSVLFLWKAGDRLLVEKGGTLIRHMAVFVVDSGSMVFENGIRTSEAGPGDLVFFAYDKEMRVVSMSSDFSCIGILFKDGWHDVLMNINPSIYAAKLYPLIPLSARKAGIITDYINEIQSLKDRGREDNDTLVINCILGLFFHLGRIYEKNISEKPKDSHVRMLSEFACLLNVHYKVRRDVDFYADALNISRSTFSSLIRQLTGYTVGSCIRKYTALKVCQMLKDSQKSVKEIALDLNFNSSSNFCKFFRDQMGVSTEEYRASYQKRLEELD